MTILFLTHYVALYGANLAMLNLAEDLQNRYGVSVTILCPYKGELVEYAKKRKIGVICSRHIPWQANKQFFIRKMARKILNPFFRLIILRKIKDISPDMIHSNSSVVDLGVKLADILQVPCVWHLREFGKEDYNLEYLVPLEEVENVYNAADYLIAVSNAVKEKYTRQFTSLNIQTIYDAVKPFEIKKQSHDSINFCCVGRICEGKGQKDILEATRILSKKYGNSFKVFFVGDGEKEYIKDIQRYIKAQNLINNVILCGYLDNIEMVLARMDVGVMASKYEAFGRVTVEYMLAEMSVISTRYGGSREILEDKGFYYNSGNPDELAQIMEQFLLKRIPIKSIGKELRELALSKFTQDINSDEIYKVYCELTRK